MEDVVLLSPIRPRPTGLGLAMRADRILRALARLHRVHLRIVPVQEQRPSAPLADAGGPAATAVQVWRPPGPWRRLRHLGDHEQARLTPRLADALAASLSGIEPGCIFVFRHVLVPLGLELGRRAGPGARVIVDLDELESSTSLEIARLLDAQRDRRGAARMRRRADRYRAREASELAAADQVWVASPADEERVLAACDVRPRLVPNVVDGPAGEPGCPPLGDTRTLLFVGGLDYAPNLDAAEWAAREIVPRVRALASRPVELRLVGAGPRRTLRSLERAPAVRALGYCPELAAEYARAAVCVVPVRGGGGTRIKLLEALAHGRPVVSTTRGAEGLALEAGRDLLIADDAACFAEACAQLLDDPARATKLAANGLARVRERYAPAAFDRAVARALAALGEGGAP